LVALRALTRSPYEGGVRLIGFDFWSLPINHERGCDETKPDYDRNEDRSKRHRAQTSMNCERGSGILAESNLRYKDRVTISDKWRRPRSKPE
jgi:hypothetical protein